MKMATFMCMCREPVGYVMTNWRVAQMTRPSKTPIALFRIEVIDEDNPAEAKIVNRPFIFSDPDSGTLAGLWDGGDHGEGTQTTSQTNQCHDITTYPEIGLAAGACSGNGILLDISVPADPKRLDQVIDPGFAYWHSATFNNDGTKVILRTNGVEAVGQDVAHRSSHLGSRCIL